MTDPDAGPLDADAPVTWCVQEESLGAAADLAYGVTLLRAVQQRVLSTPLIRVYRPEPTLAFGQRDVRLPGFDRARQAALDHGFTPVVRRAGGRAAAYHRGSLVVDRLSPDRDAIIHSRERFRVFADLYAQVLRDAGVDAAVGQVPGEYCPGEHSVHARRPEAGPATGPVKVIGTAQRVVSGAWLFSSSWVIGDPEPIRAVLVDVYAALGLSWDPSTAGSADEAAQAGAPGVDTGMVLARLRDRVGEPVRESAFSELLDRVPPDPAASAAAAASAPI